MSSVCYANYRESGIEWLGEVPAHWLATQVRRLFKIEKRISGELGYDVLSITQRGIKVRDVDSNDGQLSMDYAKYQFVYPGDFAMNHMDLLTGYVDLSTQLGVTSPDYRVFRPRNKQYISSRYYLYIFQMCYLDKIFYPLGQGASLFGRWRLPTDAFNEFCVPLPPPSEQAEIAAFLDRETAKIDALVEEQRRLIALLAEKRQAVISHAVTKGLDPTVPMKDSGVEWLGEVPAHWKVMPIRRLLSGITQGWSPECLGRPADGQEWGVLKAGCVNGGIFNPEENKSLPATLEPRPEYEVQPGDILMSRASGSPALVGACAFVNKTRPRLLMSDKIYRIRLLPDCDPEWFSILMSAGMMRAQIVSAISGAEGLANNLPQSSLKGFQCAVPPQDEQLELVQYVKIVIERLAALISEAEGAITLLQERRAALISAAVTGKIDVRGLVPAVEEAA